MILQAHGVRGDAMIILYLAVLLGATYGKATGAVTLLMEEPYRYDVSQSCEEVCPGSRPHEAEASCVSVFTLVQNTWAGLLLPFPMKGHSFIVQPPPFVPLTTRFRRCRVSKSDQELQPLCMRPETPQLRAARMNEFG